VIPAGALSLGVLAGGRGARMGGADKAWLPYRGQPLLQRCLAAFADLEGERLLSARCADPRHDEFAVRAVLDQRAGFPGPLAGLEALAAACTTPWLLTVPVDIDGVPAGLALRLWQARGDHGAVVAAADGLQPLLALWRCAALLPAARAALDDGRLAARDLVAGLALPVLDLAPLRLANFNTPEQLQEPR
jgi:molybdopterin-guanine dinucleotide biosynthesis protein A